MASIYYLFSIFSSTGHTTSHRRPSTSSKWYFYFTSFSSECHKFFAVSSCHSSRCVSIDVELLANTTQSAEHDESGQWTFSRIVFTLCQKFYPLFERNRVAVGRVHQTFLISQGPQFKVHTPLKSQSIPNLYLLHINGIIFKKCILLSSIYLWIWIQVKWHYSHLKFSFLHLTSIDFRSVLFVNARWQLE